MSRGSGNHCAILALARILEEHTDERHRLSIKELQGILLNDYGMQVSDDFISDRVADIIGFYGGTVAAEDGKRFERVSKAPRGKAWICMSRRAFADDELDQVIDAVDGAEDIDDEDAASIIARLRALQSPTARSRGGALTTARATGL